MRYLKILFKTFVVFIGLILLYGLVAIVCSYWPVHSDYVSKGPYELFVSTNGVHTDIILPVKTISPTLKKGLPIKGYYKYVAFGWGDKNFYLNTPEWKDLTVRNAIGALFLKSKTLMHVSNYGTRNKNWVALRVEEKEWNAINTYIAQSFEETESGEKIVVAQYGYTKHDTFFAANGSYSFINTCNGWANTALKSGKIKTAIWTPFDFGILHWHQE